MKYSFRIRCWQLISEGTGKDYFGKDEMSQIEDKVFTWRDRKIIHYYHPSARKSNKKLYKGLNGILWFNS